jgi:hypothetical protein
MREVFTKATPELGQRSRHSSGGSIATCSRPLLDGGHKAMVSARTDQTAATGAKWLLQAVSGAPVQKSGTAG